MRNLKIVVVLDILFCCISLSAQIKKSSPKKILVAYYSHTGNTCVVAEYIQKVTGADIRKLCPKAIVLEGLPVRGSKVVTSEQVLREWVGKLMLNMK